MTQYQLLFVVFGDKLLIVTWLLGSVIMYLHEWNNIAFFLVCLRCSTDSGSCLAASLLWVRTSRLVLWDRGRLLPTWAVQHRLGSVPGYGGHFLLSLLACLGYLCHECLRWPQCTNLLLDHRILSLHLKNK